MHGGVKVYRGAPSAARHYLQAERCRADDYYLREGAGVAEHLIVDQDGHVVERPGLSGDRYEAWVAGLDPDTGEPRGQLRTDGHAVRFVEIVVNGPKSWSLAAELHPDVAAAYEAAQDRAARQILGWLGEHATTRVGPRGAQLAVPVEKIEASVIRHYTSRAGDPHRHLHVQVNARVFAAGKWRGLDTVAVRDSIQALNGIGHAAVACDPDFRATLAAHGYTLDAGGEIAQLAPYVGAFSKRAAQIGRMIDRYEAEWRAAHPGEEPGPRVRRSWDARAWAQDRPDKVVPRDGTELRQRWLSELHQLGYHDLNEPIQLALPLPGTIDRDAAAAEVINRLGAARSGWNPADVRGEVEQLLARDGVIADPAVRGELAEDLTARATQLCVPLTDEAVPEHIRGLTSGHVLEVEADLVTRLAARGTHPATEAVNPVEPAAADLDAGQQTAVAALAGEAGLVVIEGAAGAGKTTTLAAARDALAAQGRRLVVVTPTLKAAQTASAELGARAGSAAWLAYQHGWRWDEHGTWIRHSADPTPDARLRRRDVLLCDEAGLLDQDTARALLTIADETGARVALVGDRHQLPAVGRGGVLDLAHRWAHPAATVELNTVHRFVHCVDGVNVEDSDYVGLSLAMRTGDDPAAVFDALRERGQIVLYGSESGRCDQLAEQVAAAHAAGWRLPTVMVDTREQATMLNGAIRDRLVTAGRVDDRHTTTARDGQRVGVGDRVVTRRNHPTLGVANRETWTVTAVGPDGRLTVAAHGRGRRELPAGYVCEQVELGYAVTGYGAQGDTTEHAHLLLAETTTAAQAYVGMTRGRLGNTAHLIAENVDDAREQWLSAFARDRADLGPSAARTAAEKAAADYTPAQQPAPEPVAVDPGRLHALLRELQRVWTERTEAQRRLQRVEALLELAGREAAWREQSAPILAPLRDAMEHARAVEQQRGHADAASAAAIRVAAEQHAAALRRAWHDQLGPAEVAARTVAAGPGRFGMHRGRVRDAEVMLDQWLDAWAPVLADSRIDPQHLRRYPGAWHANAPELAAALARHAQRRADGDNPGHSALEHAAEQARAAADAAATAYRQRGQQLRTEFGLPRHTTSARHVPELAREAEAARQRLAAAESTFETLVNDPVLAGPDADRLLHRAHKLWQHSHNSDNPHLRLNDPIAHPFQTRYSAPTGHGHRPSFGR